MNTLEETGEVWRGTIVERIRKTLKARIEKLRGKRVQRTERYATDEQALRPGFGIHPEADESGAAGGLTGAGRGHGRRVLQWDQGVN